LRAKLRSKCGKNWAGLGQSDEKASLTKGLGRTTLRQPLGSATFFETRQHGAKVRAQAVFILDKLRVKLGRGQTHWRIGVRGLGRVGSIANAFDRHKSIAAFLVFGWCRYSDLLVLNPIILYKRQLLIRPVARMITPIHIQAPYPSNAPIISRAPITMRSTLSTLPTFLIIVFSYTFSANFVHKVYFVFDFAQIHHFVMVHWRVSG
jgi:hypothetical protein